MQVDIVALLLVFLIASTFSAQMTAAGDGNLVRHGRRHQHGGQDIKVKIRSVHRKRVVTKPVPGGESSSGECCPTVARWVEQKLGYSRDNKLVQIYAGGKVPQRFYEVSCADGVGGGRPCRFVARPLLRYSSCVQRYSYTYALVRDFVLGGNDMTTTTTSDWRMDYIKIGSGCSCEINNRR